MNKTLTSLIFLAAAALMGAGAMGGSATTNPATAPSASTRPAGNGGGLWGLFRPETPAPQAQLKVTGKVEDEATGKPVAAFRIVPGMAFTYSGNAQPAQWQYFQATDGTNGVYQFSPSQVYPANDNFSVTYMIRIEADGYLPAASPEFSVDGNNNTYDFKLKAGKNLEGVVLTPDGQPAAKAKVMLALPGAGLGVQLSQPSAGAYPQSICDAAGKFKFFPQSGNYAVVVVHDSGYAQVDQDALAKSGTVQLQKWGRIAGVCMKGSKPNPRVQMALMFNSSADSSKPMIWLNDQCVTDKDGKFTFTRVPPGQVTIGRATNGFNNMSVTETVTVQAGQTVAVQVGGKGQTIIGHVAKPEGAKSMGPAMQGYLQSQPKMPPPTPELLAAGKKMQETMADPETSPKQKEEWAAKWSATNEGQAYERALGEYQQNMYRFQQPLMLNIDSKGAFRIEDVPPGEYQLEIYQIQTLEGGTSQVSAQVQKQITISGHSDEPMDLGELTMAVATAQSGEAAPAPALAATSLDGKSFKLSDYRGKYVLLDLWATWVPTIDAQSAALSDVYTAFGQDKRFVIISVGAADSADEFKQFVQQRPVPWLQGSLDAPEANMAGEIWGDGSLPTVVLIGPDGKAIASHLRGPGIKATVAEALSAQ